MKQSNTKNRPNKQKKYRQAQENKGLVRYEIQVKKETKDKFEKMADAAAEEYIAPLDKRQRLAKARSDVFDKLVHGIEHKFTALQEQIQSLKDEVASLSPAYFKATSKSKTPLPEVISSLPDDPHKLKRILAETYRVAQIAKISSKQNKEDADRLQRLYDASYDYNETLEKKLKELKEIME